MSSRARRQVIAVSLLLVVVTLLLMTFQVAVVRGASMLPTYSDGQIVLVNRLHSDRASLHRGDVVLIHREGDPDVIIKRVAFLPGETLNVRESLRFRRVLEKFERVPAPPGAGFLARFRVQVPKDHVVVLGDNPEVSEDSRLFGPVRTSEIIGRVIGAPPGP